MTACLPESPKCPWWVLDTSFLACTWDNSDTVRLISECAWISQTYSVLLSHNWFGFRLTISSQLHLLTKPVQLYMQTHVVTSFNYGAYSLFIHFTLLLCSSPKQELQDAKKQTKNKQEPKRHENTHPFSRVHIHTPNNLLEYLQNFMTGDSVFKYWPVAYTATNGMLLQKRMTHQKKQKYQFDGFQKPRKMACFLFLEKN